MTQPVQCWMQDQGLYVSREFDTGWGRCDLVGCQFDSESVALRTAGRQRQPLGSAQAVRVYSLLPDAGTSKRGVSAKEIARRSDFTFSEQELEQLLTRLVSARHATRSRYGAYQKINGWAPLARRFIAVELKLKRWTEALQQARHNQVLAPESFVGLPYEDAERAARSDFRNELQEYGIGLIAVAPDECKVLIPAECDRDQVDNSVSTWATEYFWRRYRGKH